jgi:hypothetical protein
MAAQKGDYDPAKTVKVFLVRLPASHAQELFEAAVARGRTKDRNSYRMGQTMDSARKSFQFPG